jgi:Na+/proline symporter
MISAKNEKHSFLGYFWFNLWHVVLRPWPWIIVGMAAAILFPGIAQKNPLTGQLETNPELGYIAVMLTYLKPGFLGLMLAAFLAAFMSTISAQINWGASYLINDFYRPFIKKDASEKHYVRVSIIAVIFSAIIGGIVSFFMENIFTGWLLLWAINAGIGVVYIARWYWWRVNAWSEISAIACLIGVIAVILLVDSVTLIKFILISLVLLTLIALIIFGLSKKEWRNQYFGSSIFILSMIVLSLALVISITLPEKNFPWTLIYTLPISLAVWLTATMLTKPTDEDRLIDFYERTHPGGPGWNKIASKIEKDYSAGHLFTKRNIIGCIFGIIGTYAALIGFGHLMLGKLVSGSILIALLILSIYVIVKNLTNEKWETVN